MYAGWSIAPRKSPSAGSVAVPVGPAGPVVYSPWCDQGSAEKPIPVQTIADYISETPRKTLTQLSRSDARVEVHTAKPRTSSLEGEPREQQHGLWGCYASKLACRATVPGPIADSIDNITDMLASWVQSLGAGAAQKCDSLACMRGVHPTTGLRKDVIVLLLMSRQQPSLQLYARCAIDMEDAAGADGAEVLPEALPCVVSLRIVQSRLSSHFRAVDICSSEELAQQLATSELLWSIHPLTWHMPADRRQLQDHIVTGVGERFMPKEKKTSRVHRPGRDGDENPVLCDDPLAAGRAAAAARSGGASPSAFSGLAAAVMHDLGALDLGAEDPADGDVFADLPADVVEDLREEIFGPEPAAEGVFVDREEGSEGASAEGSSSSAEEGASPREERGSAEEGASPSEDPAPGAEDEGWCPLRGRSLAQQPSIQTLAQS